MYRAYVNVEKVIQIKSGIIINVSASVKKKNCVWEGSIWNAAACSCGNGKYLASIGDDSVITWDENIEETKTIPKNLNETNKKKSNL